MKNEAHFEILRSDLGSTVGAVVRALVSHQCDPGSIPGPGVICELSLLLVLALLRGFSSGTSVFLPLEKQILIRLAKTELASSLNIVI